MARPLRYATEIPVGGFATIDGMVTNVRETRTPGVLFVDVDVFDGPTRVLVLGLRETFRPSQDLRAEAMTMLGDSWTFTVVRPSDDDIATGCIHEGLMVIEDAEMRHSMLMAA